MRINTSNAIEDATPDTVARAIAGQSVARWLVMLEESDCDPRTLAEQMRQTADLIDAEARGEVRQ